VGTIHGDDSGAVDVVTASAEEGTYLGTEPDGLVWSAVSDPSVTSKDPYTIEIIAEIDGVALPSVDVDAWFFR